MPLDRPTVSQLSSSIGVLHSYGAFSLDSALNISIICKLENVSGMADDEKTGKTYLLHSTAHCKNMLSVVKVQTTEKDIPEEPEIHSNIDETRDILLKHSINKEIIADSLTYSQARTNIHQLSHNLITRSVSDCSSAIVKLAMPI